MCILLFSIRLAIIIFLDIFYSKNSKKSSSSRLGAAAPSFLEDLANSSSTSPLVISRKRLHDDQKSDLNEIIEDLDSPESAGLDGSLKGSLISRDSLYICVTLSSVVTDIYFTLDGTGPATRLPTITSIWRHLAPYYVRH